MSRRDDVIEEAASLLRSGGPASLTSTNVARALGVTQSAIYRHVRDMDELSTIASRMIVADLTSLLEAMLVDPDIEWGEPGDYERISARLATAIIERSQEFDVLDRWRWDPGALGCGIRELLANGVEVIAGLIEFEWHAVHDDTPFDETARHLTRAHAVLLQDDVIAVARAHRERGSSADRAELAQLLALRLRAGWQSFCLDVNGHLGVAEPELVFP